MKGGRATWVWVAGLLALAGCEDTTQLVVVVDSDLEPGVEITRIQVSAATSAAGHAATAEFDLAEEALPLSFGIAPFEAADETVYLTVHALDGDGRPRLGHRATTGFVSGEIRRLEVPLARACLPVECVADEVCVRGECVDPFVEPTSLALGPGSDPPAPLFEGPRVAQDGGVPDAGDACTEGAPCDLGECARGVRRCGQQEPICFLEATVAVGTGCEGDGQCDESGRCIH